MLQVFKHLISSPLALVIYVQFFDTSQAQSLKRLGVIDIEADTLTNDDRQAVLSELKTSLNDQRILALVRDQEVDSKLIQKSKSKADIEKIRNQHLERQSEIENLLEEGQKFFRASNFEDAIRTFERALPVIPQASLVITSNIVSELFQFMGASHYFLGNEIQAKSYFSALLDLNPDAFINAQKLPPPVVELFNSVKSGVRYEMKPWVFDCNARELKVSLAGHTLKVSEADRVTVMIPKEHQIWGSMNLVVEREGFGSAIFAMNDLPKEVRLVSTRDRRLVTRGLFAPLGATTPPIELKKLVVNLDLSVIFLGSVSKDLEGRWLLRGQWLEGPTSRTSPIVESSDAQMKPAVRILVKDLMEFLDASGRVISSKTSLPMATTMSENQESLERSTPYYQTWWFWTLVGVGVAGAGVGGYYLLQPAETLNVKVVQAN